ncbi:mechanosensitive ion channel domain-containing protein [Niveibacterium sp. SC-1]|uniref:mechanosensitive ion channel family protein n=1 Tax=Niveibacterium sp. SC-1 TaxID=3135646 RepID=UPI0031201A29
MQLRSILAVPGSAALRRWLLPLLLCLCAVATAAETASAPTGIDTSEEEGAVVVLNRTIAVFRTSFFGIGPKDRARRTRRVIEDQLATGGPGHVTIENVDQGRLLKIDGKMVLGLTPDDADKLTHESLDHAAQRAADMLAQVIAESRESRDANSLLRAAALAGLASLILLVLLWALFRVRAWLFSLLLRWTHARTERIRVGGAALIASDRVFVALRWLLRGLYSLVAVLLAYQWLSFVLSRFPYTRPWGERLNEYLLELVERVLGAIVGAVPDLLIALIVFFIARGINDVLRAFFDRVENGQLSVSWLSEDTISPTRKIAAGIVWLFALAMAYPYLPGAQTEAFKGLSVLIGLMISLGASSLVGQAASGLILMYTHTLRAGEYVRISDSEGTVMEVGLFSTRIRTGLGEELTYANSMILGNITRNYSRAVKGPGFVVDTTVTIGYDAAWRQVQAMLITAALRTPGVLADPAPRVFQTALSDFYVEYRLVAQAVPAEPRPRAEVLNQLHANILDVFNEHGVQIMSPHYFEDPAQAKVVAPSDWYPAPAKAPQEPREGA